MRRALRLLPFTLCLSHCLSNAVHASEASAQAENPYLTELPVVLSASRLLQAQSDAPGAVTILDRAQIRASGLRDIAELLRLAPGFVSTLAYGSYPAAGYHGLTRDRSNRMLVLIDGRSAYSPYFLGGVEWNQLGVDIDDIERIEIFRGSNSATYGANAFLGVVNITTRNARSSERLSVSQQRGDDGIRDTSAAGSLIMGKLATRVRVREQRDDGFEGYFDGRRLRMLDLRSDYQIDSARRIEFHAGSNRADVRRGYPEEAGDPPRWTHTNQNYALLRLSDAPDANHEWRLSFYHQQGVNKDAYTQTAQLDKIVPPSVLAYYGLPNSLDITFDDYYKVTRDDVELQRIQPLGQNLRAVWGAGLRLDRVHAPRHFNERQTVDVYSRRAFGNLEWRPAPQWVANSGLMLENTSLSGTKPAPRLALNYHANSVHTLRMAWSRAYRVATPYEVYSDTKYKYNDLVLRWTDAPAGDLKPERITALELGWLAEWRAHHSTLDVRIFDEKLEDLIEDRKFTIRVPQDQLDPSRTEVRTSANQSWARIYGVEYQLAWRPANETWISLTQAFMNIRSNQEKNLRSAPHVSTVISASKRWGRMVGSLSHYRYGTMNWQQTDRETIAPYHRTDLRLSYDTTLLDSRAQIFFVAQNLGQGNAEFKPVYQTNARYFGGVRWEY